MSKAYLNQFKSNTKWATIVDYIENNLQEYLYKF